MSSRSEPTDIETGMADASYDAEMASSGDVRTGYLTGPGIFQLPVEYNVVDGIALWGGCIDMGPVDEVEAEAARIRAATQGKAEPDLHSEEDQADETTLFGVGLPGTSSFLWPNGRVPYAINANITDPNRITQAIQHLEERSAIRMILRTPANAAQHPNWVEFVQHATINSSPIGMRGGRQVIRLTAGAPLGTIVHEIMHSLGIYHEQSRDDRDSFVEIRWQNIDPEAINNFQKVPGSVDYYDYDYGSLMHYHRRAFSINTQDTIVPRQAGVTIGQRSAMSWGDRQTIAKIYERFFTKGYSGVWRAHSGRYGLWANATWASFQPKWQEFTASGLRLIDIHTRRVGNTTRYTGVFRAGSGGHALWANSQFSTFRDKWQDWSGQGLRLVGLHVHRVGNQNRYSGCWLPGSGAYGLWVNASWTSFRAKWQEWNQAGMRLVDIHVHRVNGQNRYSGVWLAGSGSYGLWVDASWASFTGKWREWSNQGMRLVDLNIHRANGQNRYSGVWRQGSGSYALWANVTWESFRAKWQELAERGMQLVDYDFPASEVGLLGDAAAAALADAEIVTTDPGLDLDGFGGIYGDAMDLELDTGLPMAAQPEAPEGYGGMVAEAAMAAAAAPDADGQGEAVLPAAGVDRAAAEADGLGGSGGDVTATPFAAGNGEGGLARSPGPEGPHVAH